MTSPRRQRIFAFWLSVLFHGLIVIALTFSIPLSFQTPSAGPVIVPIDTVMIDETALNAAIAEVEAEKQAEIRQQQETERREQQRQDQIRRDREEAIRVAEEQRIALAAEAQAERERQLQAERDRVEAERRAAEERRQREAEEAARREAELVAQREAERVRQQQAAAAADIARSIAAEQQAQANSGARAQWAAAIGRKVEQRWQRPLNVTSELECLLVVNQLPDGSVVDSEVRECNTSDETIIRSLENAVLNASPLPPRPPGVAFERVVRIRFKPTE